MSSETENRIFDLPRFRGRTGVFADRGEAGKVLSEMLGEFRGGDGIVMAIPAGGVPLGAVIARELGLPLDVAVVSKITPSWNTEVGYGAVAFDGTVRLNEEVVRGFGLGQQEIQEGTARTIEKVTQRTQLLRGARSFPDLSHKMTILVDDGLASGFTMRVAVEALRKTGASRIIVAVPTAHSRAIQRLIDAVDAVYCANVRGGWSFAVADAYRKWTDIDEDAAAKIVKEFKRNSQRG